MGVKVAKPRQAPPTAPSPHQALPNVPPEHRPVRPETKVSSGDSPIRWIGKRIGKYFASPQLWKDVSSWTLVGVLVPLGIGMGGLLMTIQSPQLELATVCYIVSALILLLKVLVWLVTIHANKGVKMVLVFFIFGVVGVALWAALQWIWKPHLAPTVFAQTSTSQYGSGTSLSGITWSLRFTELRVVIANQNRNTDLSNLDFTLKPDAAVVQASQSSDLPDVAISPENAAPLHALELVDMETSKRRPLPLVLIASNEGYRIRCKQLLRNQRLEIVLALANMREFSSPPPPGTGVLEPGYVLRIANGDIFYWYGYGRYSDGRRIEDVFSLDRPVPSLVQIDGRYSANSQEHEFKSQVQVFDLVKDALLHINGKQPKSE